MPRQQFAPMITTIHGLKSPWEASDRQVMTDMARLLPCEGAMLTLDPPEPRLRHVLLAWGSWDKLAAAEPVASSRHGGKKSNGMMARHEVTWSDPLTTWRLSLARHGDEFDERERALVLILLQNWYGRFMQPSEPGMARLLLREDFLPLALDQAAQTWRVTGEVMIEPLLDRVRTVLRQRYPRLEAEVTYESVVGDAARPIWTRLRFMDGCQSALPRPICVELRMLDAGEVPVIHQVEDPRVALAVGHLDQHFTQAPSLRAIAEAVGMSPFHFHRMFSKQAGVSPKHYVLARQVQFAKWLLRTEEMPVAEVAARCGFTSHGHFTATFHRLVGMKPSVYRSGHREGS